MAHRLWLQLDKGRSVAPDSPAAEPCTWALATRFLHLDFLKRVFRSHKNQWVPGAALPGRSVHLFCCSHSLRTSRPPTSG